MIIVETPDMEGDIKGKKNTLVVKIGRKNTYLILLLCLIIASAYFFIISFLDLFNKYIDFSIVFGISLIPVFIGTIGWIYRPFTKKIATKIATVNMYSLVVYLFIFNVYLITLILYS